MDYWTALSILKQVAGELGLPAPVSLVSEDTQVIQLTALLNSVGNELNTYYPWEQFTKFHEFNTVNGVDGYDLPTDWLYYIDQTQWDGTNRWPLLGPKTPQEWNWLKRGNIATPPRMRYRIYQDKLMLLPVPGATPLNISLEYINKYWVNKGSTLADMITQDSDSVLYYPWLVIKFVKLKFYELKGFDTTAAKGDFMRLFLTMTGKDKGAPVLSLTPINQQVLIGPWSVPDGSWPIS